MRSASQSRTHHLTQQLASVFPPLQGSSELRSASRHRRAVRRIGGCLFLSRCGLFWVQELRVQPRFLRNRTCKKSSVTGVKWACCILQFLAGEDSDSKVPTKVDARMQSYTLPSSYLAARCEALLVSHLLAADRMRRHPEMWEVLCPLAAFWLWLSLCYALLLAGCRRRITL